MTRPATIAIEATKEAYYGLKHMPRGLPLDKNGKGEWPADQFTFRLIAEGALRRQPEIVVMKTPAAGKTTVRSLLSDPSEARIDSAAEPAFTKRR